MKISTELRAACAVNAAVIGATFSSGREAASFFACAGWASWPGIAASSALFGLILGMIAHFARETGARDLPGIYYRKLDERCGDAIGVVHALLMLMMGAVALSTAGELGMLALSARHPYLLSAGIAVALAVAASIGGLKPLSALGMVLVPVVILFFTALAIDPRPAQAGAYLTVIAEDLRGNFSVAVMLGALFACLKAAMACGVAAVYAPRVEPRRFGLLCGVIMALIAASINCALQRGGEGVWALNLPAVVLAARWGVFGYYASIAVMWLGGVAVLSCAISSIMALFSARISRPAAALMTAVGVILMSVAGLRALVSIGYPLLGWVCALCLCALAFFYERKGKRSVVAVKGAR